MNAKICYQTPQTCWFDHLLWAFWSKSLYPGRGTTKAFVYFAFEQLWTFTSSRHGALRRLLQLSFDVLKVLGFEVEGMITMNTYEHNIEQQMKWEKKQVHGSWGPLAVQCQGSALTMNQREPAVYTAISQTFCRSKSENILFELDMRCFMVLLYTILRNLACMKPENWWDYPYSLLRILDVILVSWVSVNSDDSRCIVSFWKMWVFHCSASLPQGEYVL